MGSLGVLVVTLCFLLTNLPGGGFQEVDNSARNIFDALSTTLDCGKFKALIIAAGLQTQDFYKMAPGLTVFVPNDTAFNQMLPYRRQKILNMTPAQKENYVKAYTLPRMLQTSSMTENLMEESLGGGPSKTKIFFKRRSRGPNEIVRPGVTQYYANGALIYKPDVRVQNGIIQVIDQVLDPIVPSQIYAYIRQPNQTSSISMRFFTDITSFVTGQYYLTTISPLQTSSRFTMFVPTDEAIAKIPQEKLEELRSRPPQLAEVVQQHVIEDKAVYTSYVYHNEGYQCTFGRAIFKKNVRDTVSVSAGGVNAQITLGNLTLSNGVIHLVDSLLGYVYNTAREQVQLDEQLKQFSEVLSRGRKDLQDFLAEPTGVTIFAPINEAFDSLRNLPGVDFFNNQTLIDYVLELHLLEPGTRLEITNVNGDYQSRLETRTQYRGWNVKIYSQGNDTWAEGGYVKTRVIRPDVGTTNGFIHYIDGVFGVPSRDVPGIIYCEDWLIKSSYLFSITGLNDYMKDERIRTALPPCSYNVQRRDYNYADPNLFGKNRNGTYGSGGSSYGQTVSSLVSREVCREDQRPCEFTVFVPNGTTVENFQRGPYGRELFRDNNRLRYVLRRHIALNRKIYIDQLSRGSHTYISATGDEVRFIKQSNYYTEVNFLNVRARVIHSDLGATNGVIHIVDDFLFVQADLLRDISAGSRISSYFVTLMSFVFTVFNSFSR